jgi:hypothetical protein
MGKDKISFGKILGKSWEDYKSNFYSIFKFMLVFVGIPSLMISVLLLILSFSIEWFIPSYSIYLILSLFISLFFLLLFFIILILFADASLIGISLEKSRFNFKEMIKIGRSFYLKYIGFTIVVSLFLIGLFLLLIVPGIIFSIYWIFAVYVLYYEKKGILSSLKRSREIVKGNWWKVFGYLLLISLILYGVSYIIGFISFPTSVIYNSLTLAEKTVPLIISVSHFLLSNLSNFLVNLIQIPITILFLKNFYLEMKENAQES